MKKIKNRAVEELGDWILKAVRFCLLKDFEGLKGIEKAEEVPFSLNNKRDNNGVGGVVS